MKRMSEPLRVDELAVSPSLISLPPQYAGSRSSLGSRGRIARV